MPISGYTGLIGLPKAGLSPIDLDDKIVRPRRLSPLFLNGHWLNEGEATLTNNGKSAKVLLGGNRIPSTITGGPLISDGYEFSNCHFHWGEDNCNGSEHTVNGTWFSMEAHVVHWNRKYLTFEECLKHKDGFCVLAIFFIVTPGPCGLNNSQFEKITENLKYITDTDSSVKIPANCLCWMRLVTQCQRYYYYRGSFNEGSNPECATWIVFPLIVPIRPCQIAAFRTLERKDGTLIKSNCRKVQHLRGRRIFLAIS